MLRFSAAVIFCMIFCFPVIAQAEEYFKLPLECLPKQPMPGIGTKCYDIQIDGLQKKIDSNLNKIYQSKNISEAYKEQIRKNQQLWLAYAKAYSVAACPVEDCKNIEQTTARRMTEQFYQRNDEIDRLLKELEELITAR